MNTKIVKCPNCDWEILINKKDWSTQKHTPSYMNSKTNESIPKVILLECMCGHGGKAWHDQVFGKCTYGGCNCQTMNVKIAYTFEGNNDNDLNKEQFYSWLDKHRNKVMYT